MLPVLLLFLIPIGGGIPAGVLLARHNHLGWPVMEVLYLVSDVILAVVFEPILRLLVQAGRKVPAMARFAEAMRKNMERTAALYGGVGGGPFVLILIAFGVDPMTGRAAALAAGHGFVAGWAIAIAGDMLYFTVLMVLTLQLNDVLGDPERTMGLILLAMILIPMAVRRLRAR